MMPTRKLLLPTIAVIALAVAAACSPDAPTDATLESRASPDDSALAAAPETRALDDQSPAPPIQSPDFTSPRLSPPPGTTLEAAPTGGSSAVDATAALGEVSHLRDVSKAALAEWRRTLDRIARVSKRGETAVVLRRMVLDALEAPSDGEYRQILLGLRARMAAAGTAVGGGDASTLSRRGDDTRAGSPLGRIQGSDQWGTAESSEAFFEGDELEGSASESHLGYFEVLPVHECSTTWEGVLYEGECATQQELDDDIALMEALEVEITADYSEAVAECISKYANDCPAFMEEEESQFALVGSSATWFASPTSQVTSWAMTGTGDQEDADGFTCNPTAGPFDNSQASNIGCLGEAATAVGAMGGYVYANFATVDAFRNGGVSKLARFAMSGALWGVAFSTGYFIGSWLNCMT